MIAPEFLIATVMVISLILYALMGGADYGGGVWDLFAFGPRADLQRKTISTAIGPVWEANHVWIILVVVLLFAGFPPAYAAICIALYIPVTLLLIGIILRGAAFAFRSYGRQSDKMQRNWGRVFAIASVITPFTLGVIVGAIASGKIVINTKTGEVLSDYISTWLAPFPIALGFLTVCLFAFLAAVYLILETQDAQLKEDFRFRALAAAFAVGVCAWISFGLAKEGAPRIRQGLYHSSWSIPFHLITGVVAVGAIVTLFKRHFKLARIFAVLQVTLIILGWALSQFPYIIYPSLTFTEAASPPQVLRLMFVTLVLGSFVLLPSFWYLFSIFKFTPTEEKGQK